MKCTLTISLGVLVFTLGAAPSLSQEPSTQSGAKAEPSVAVNHQGGLLTREEGRRAFLSILKRQNDAISDQEVPYEATISKCQSHFLGVHNGDVSFITSCRISISPANFDRLVKDFPVTLRRETVQIGSSYVCPNNAEFPATAVYYPSESLRDWDSPIRDITSQNDIAIYVNAVRSELLACQKSLFIR